MNKLILAITLVGSCSTIDYTQRITQFLDNYLKGAQAPKWMTRGVPARLKDIYNGLELDTEIRTPGYHLLIRKNP